MAFLFKILALFQPCSQLSRASTSSGTVAPRWTAGMHVQQGSSGAAVQPTVYPFWGSSLRVWNGVDRWKNAAQALLKCAELQQIKSNQTVGVNSPEKIQFPALENGEHYKSQARETLLAKQTMTFETYVLWTFARQKWNNFLVTVAVSATDKNEGNGRDRSF